MTDWTAEFYQAIHHARYLLLTTMSASGVLVHTPVWFDLAGERVVVRCASSSGKVRRIQRRSGVWVATSSALGRPRTASVPAVATVLPAGSAQLPPRAVDRRYPVMMRAYSAWSLVRGRRGESVYLILEAPDSTRHDHDTGIAADQSRGPQSG